jgi:predicted nucleotidyltransferase
VENCRGIDLILRVVLAWATAQPKIRAVALVGSHARGTAGPASDIDLVLLTTPPDSFRADTTWGRPNRLVQTLNGVISDGAEVLESYDVTCTPPTENGRWLIINNVDYIQKSGQTR